MTQSEMSPILEEVKEIRTRLDRLVAQTNQ